MKAAGVEPSGVLTAPKLLMIGTATRAKKTPLPDPLYVYCTKMLTLWIPADPHSNHSILIDSPVWIERKHPASSSVDYDDSSKANSAFCFDRG